MSNSAQTGNNPNDVLENQEDKSRYLSNRMLGNAPVEGAETCTVELDLAQLATSLSHQKTFNQKRLTARGTWIRAVLVQCC